MQFVIWSFKHQQWWRPHAMGDTPDLGLAGLYTAEEAAGHALGDVMMNTLPVQERHAELVGAPKFHPYNGDS